MVHLLLFEIGQLNIDPVLCIAYLFILEENLARFTCQPHPATAWPYPTPQFKTIPHSHKKKSWLTKHAMKSPRILKG